MILYIVLNINTNKMIKISVKVLLISFLLFFYNIEEISQVIKEQNISIAIITTPSQVAKATAERLVMAGTKGILNFTPISLNVTPNVYLEEYDMTTSLEKVAYFVKK